MSMEEVPRCKDCGQPMFEVGGIGKTIDLDLGEKEYKIHGIDIIYKQREFGRREVKLYQCPEDKTIAID